MNENNFVVVKAKVEIRQGAKRPWLEMKITGTKDGVPTVKKLICREVREFYSEQATADDYSFEQ